MADFGQLALALAFACSSIGLVAAGCSLVHRTGVRLPLAMMHAASAGCAAGTFALVVSLLQHDFQIRYVAEHTDRSLPTVYLLAAVWGGQGGSLLLWTLLLCVFSVIAVRSLHKTQPKAVLPAAAILLLVMSFFSGLIVYVSDPFARTGLVPADGAGLNPLLRTPEMLLHPPALYLGFVGSTIPLALLLGGLIARGLDASMMRLIRRWTIFSWVTLTVGIILGAEWAYVELGWGGYWAWDPVENASLLPWLSMTAAIHGMVLVRRQGMFRLTTYVLISLTFALCVFGTLLVRSGIVASVHAFGKSPLLYFLLGLLAVTAVLCTVAALTRRDMLRSDRRVRSFISRDGLFIGVFAVLLGSLAVIFWGTILPVFSEMVAGRQMTWDVSRYNLATAPFALALLALMGTCALIVRRDRWRIGAAIARFAASAAAGIACGVAAYALLPSGEHAGAVDWLQFRLIPPVLVGLAAACGVALLQAILGEIITRAQLPPRARLGAFAIHLGTVLLLGGLAGSAYVDTREVTLRAGETVDLGKYAITFDGMRYSDAPDGSWHEAAAILSYSAGSSRGVLAPKMVFYSNSERPHADVSVRTGLSHDLYAILSAVQQDSASFKLIVYPLAIWLWIGGGLMLLGGIVVLMPRRLAATVEEKAESDARPAGAYDPFCPDCGARIVFTDAKFCPHCGAGFEEQHVEG